MSADIERYVSDLKTLPADEIDMKHISHLDSMVSDFERLISVKGRLCAQALDVIQTTTALTLELARPEHVLGLIPSLLTLYASSAMPRDSSADEVIMQLGKRSFMLSKDSVNDALFCNVHHVEAVLAMLASLQPALKTNAASNSSSVLWLSPEPSHVPLRLLIYAVGSLKNISTVDDRMLKLLATSGAVAKLSESLRWRAHPQSQQGELIENKEIAQLLVQVTGILRNMSAATKHHLKQFVESHVAARLCALVPSFLSHQELMVNVSRILSKLTLHEAPRAQIHNQRAHLQQLASLVDAQQNQSLCFQSSEQQQTQEHKHQDVLLIRSFFALGNLCAGNDANRCVLAMDCDLVPALLTALEFYAQLYLLLTDRDQEDGESDDGSAQEVLVKLVRLLANLAMNADVGTLLNAQERLDVLLDVLERSLRCEHEELMLNIVSCLTNLSYFCTQSDRAASEGFVMRHRLVLTSLLARILVDRNEEAVVEAARAFGNLSRWKDVLAAMQMQRALTCLVLLLDHSNREIVYAVCGVLMNAALDESSRQSLLQLDTDTSADVCDLLIGLVQCAGADDVEMGAMACKVLYNLLLSRDSGQLPLSLDQRETLCRVLREVVETLRVRRRDHDEDDEDDGRIGPAELLAVASQLLKSIKR